VDAIIAQAGHSTILGRYRLASSRYCRTPRARRSSAPTSRTPTSWSGWPSAAACSSSPLPTCWPPSVT